MTRYRDPLDQPCFRAVFEAPQRLSVWDTREARRAQGARAMSSWSKSSAATTFAHATRGGCFKRCCLKSGRFDGAERNHYFREEW